MPPRVEFSEQNLSRVGDEIERLEREQGLEADLKHLKQQRADTTSAPSHDSRHANGGAADDGQAVVSTPSKSFAATLGYFEHEIVWRNVVLMALLHYGALVGVVQCFASAQWKTVVAAYVMYVMGGLGITAGAHRLWAHRSYKAKWPLRVLLAAFNTSAFENSIYDWSRDHRTHHKYSETDADPHNAVRGFFFSHVGWLLIRKHNLVKTKGKQIDVSDLIADPIIRFQHKYYLPLVFVGCFVVPTLVPYLLWNETFYNSLFVCGLLRYVFILHMTWLVNSAAHMWGRRPYDKTINPSENRFVSLGALGEGFHNYHHTFPWDYATSELGYEINLTKMFIDAAAFFGLAYERKVVKPDMIRHRKLRTGDVVEKGAYGPYN